MESYRYKGDTEPLVALDETSCEVRSTLTTRMDQRLLFHESIGCSKVIPGHKNGAMEESKVFCIQVST